MRGAAGGGGSGLEERAAVNSAIIVPDHELQAVERKEHIVVGVNDFVAEKDREIPTLRIDPQIEREQIARVQALRAKRDAGRAKSALDELQCRARISENLLPAILGAVEAYATVGEISDALRQVFGEYQESVVI